MAHDNNKHKTIHHLRPPGSSIAGAASKVFRYQKYVVGDVHSGTYAVSLNFGQLDHGNVTLTANIFLCVLKKIKRL